jgi:methylamine---corrinoid protein Co-methyltransferase
MQQKPDIVEILRRTQEGEYCDLKEWDVKRIPRTVRAMLKKYDLVGVCDKVSPVNLDMELADRFYQAGFELALVLGMLCEPTERIVRISKEELSNALKFAPSELTLGFGKDARVLKARTPEDPYPCMFGASLGITVTEEVYPLLTEGIARQQEVDFLEGGSLATVNGLDVLPGTPSETLLGYVQGRRHREIRNQAGRAGMPGIGNISAVTEFGQFCYGTKENFYNTDLSLILFPSELKVNYQTLHKVVHTLAMDGLIFAGSPAMIGGMPGPAEGAVLSCIACALLQYAVLQCSVGGGEIYDIRYLSNVNREGLWALSMTHQALSRNTHILTHGIANEVSGPGTAAFLYEILVGVSIIAASGASFSTGPRAAGGKLTDYLSPLECRFCAEVAHAASGWELSKVKEMAEHFLPKYEDAIKDPDVGKPVKEVWDLENFKPLPEAEAVYRQVKQEAIDFGFPLDEF